MAKFRQNHSRESRGKMTGNLIRTVGILGFLVVGLIYFIFNKNEIVTTPATSFETPIVDDQGNAYYYPSGGRGELIEHGTYALSYVEKYEQAEWVAYELTKESLRLPNVPRKRWFEEDPMIASKSAKHSDYSNSGYTRGHLIPSADRAYSKEDMASTYYMSNMSPQLEKFNGGIWNELENQVRSWAIKNNSLIVITGPILNDQDVDTYIGKRSKIGVPDYFYKVLLDVHEPEKKAIGFIVPHEKSDRPLSDFMVTVDEVENRTGLDFFGDLLSSELESKLESEISIGDWKLDQGLYNKRVKVWNR